MVFHYLHIKFIFYENEHNPIDIMFTTRLMRQLHSAAEFVPFVSNDKITRRFLIALTGLNIINVSVAMSNRKSIKELIVDLEKGDGRSILFINGEEVVTSPTTS